MTEPLATPRAAKPPPVAAPESASGAREPARLLAPQPPPPGATRAAARRFPPRLGVRLPDVSRLAPHASPRRDSLRRRTLALNDILALCLSHLVVWLTVPAAGQWEPQLVWLAALPPWVLLNKMVGLYDRDSNVIHKSTLDELPRIVQSVVLGASTLFLLGPLITSVPAGRGQTLVFIGAALFFTPLLRTGTRAVFNRYGSPERCLILGSGAVAQDLAAALSSHPEYRVQVVGCLDQEAAEGQENGETASNDEIGQFERVCKALDVERVLIAFSQLRHEELLSVIRTSKQLNLKVTLVPRLFEAVGGGVEVDQVHGMTLFGLRGLARTRSSLFLKRTGDLLLSLIALILLTPLLAAVLLAIRLESRGPVLFRQRRIGRHNQPFSMLKFRTMHVGADELKPSLAHLNEAAAPMFKIAEDPRLTRVGRVLRRFSLDELPQLWNVLRGEMSLVGPRPLVPDEDELVIGHHRDRLDLTPGLTGPWQVMGRTRVPFAEMIKLDYQYVAQWSLWTDFKLLVRTVPVVLRGDGR